MSGEGEVVRPHSPYGLGKPCGAQIGNGLGWSLPDGHCSDPSVKKHLVLSTTRDYSVLRGEGWPVETVVAKPCLELCNCLPGHCRGRQRVRRSERSHRPPERILGRQGAGWGEFPRVWRIREAPRQPWRVPPRS